MSELLLLLILALILIFTPDTYIGSKYRLSVYLICNNRYRYRPWKTHIGRPLLYTIDIWSAVCVYLSSEQWELIARCMRLKKRSVHEREHFYQHVNRQRIVTPGKNWKLVTQSLALRVLRPLFQIVSLRFGNLSVHCRCHTVTSYANAPYPMTEMHILKDKTVNLAYRMYFECPVVLK